MSTERPILFSGPMVRAILDGSKTMTRRIVKLPRFFEPTSEDDDFELDGEPPSPHAIAKVSGCLAAIPCPYGVPGDRLWVRETWQEINWQHPLKPPGVIMSSTVHYRADDEPDPRRREVLALLKWKPSIFMPRRASRITLEITEVRVERLQEIGTYDAIREGFPGVPRHLSPRHAFAIAWNEMYGVDGCQSWEANPWIWKISFWRAIPEPSIYPCGCSHLKVQAGRCDLYSARAEVRA